MAELGFLIAKAHLFIVFISVYFFECVLFHSIQNKIFLNKDYGH
jgi:hypothetical protein